MIAEIIIIGTKTSNIRLITRDNSAVQKNVSFQIPNIGVAHQMKFQPRQISHVQ